MSKGLRTEWVKGPRSMKMVSEHGKEPRPLLGKNKGPIIEQRVTKRMVPK